MPDLTPEKLAELRRLLDAATPGPWFWWGNTDTHSVALCGRQPGLGVCEVISSLNEERSIASRDADQQREGMRDAGYTEAQIAKAIEEWAEDEWGYPRTDARLSVTDEHYIRRTAEELAVYQVARAQGLPDDTPRDHPKVYRADVCDLRAPNARLIPAAVNALPALLGAAAERDALAAKLDAVREWIDRRGVNVDDRDDDYMRGYRDAQRHALLDANELRGLLDATPETGGES